MEKAVAVELTDSVNSARVETLNLKNRSSQFYTTLSHGRHSQIAERPTATNCIVTDFSLPLQLHIGYGIHKNTSYSAIMI